MAVSADELNGFRRDRYFARSWALLTLEKGWWKPVLLVALFGLIPIVGPLAMLGYVLETARVTAWGINAGPKQSEYKFGAWIATGFKALVIALAYGILYGLVLSIAGFIPVFNIILVPIICLIGILVPILLLVVQVRTAVYGRISAGFSFKNIGQMIQHDPAGLFRIFGMSVVLIFVISIVMGILGGSVVMSVVVNAFTQFMHMTQPRNTNQLVVILIALLARNVIALGPVFFVLSYLSGVIGLVNSLLLDNAIALWMRQFNVPAWGQTNDPLPPFINDPREGSYAAVATTPVSPTSSPVIPVNSAAQVATPATDTTPTVTPVVPDAPVTPVAPEASVADTSVSTTATPTAPEASVVSAVPEPAASVTPAVPATTTTAPATPTAPAAPAMASATEQTAPAVPATPEVPAVPEAPAAPSTDTTAATIIEPVIPSAPAAPVAPAVPQNDVSDTSETSQEDTPDAPEPPAAQ